MLLATPAAATTIVANPDPFTLSAYLDDGREAHMTWTLLEGSYDPTENVTTLLFDYTIQQVSHQPNGTIAFDVPILYAQSGSGGFIFLNPDHPEEYWGSRWGGNPDDELIWAEVGPAPPITLRSTFGARLEGIPTSATFTMSGVVSQTVTFRGLSGGETAVPEPFSGLLLGAGGLIVGAALRRP